MRIGRRFSVTNRIACRACSVSTLLAALFAAALLCGTAAPARAQEVLAVVNGTPVTSYDVEQRTKLVQLSTHKTPSRKDVLQELIDELLKINEAKKFTVSVTDADVDRAFNTMAGRMGMNGAQLVKALASHGINAGTLKTRIRADLVWGELVRGRFQASLAISDRDIESVINKEPGDKNTVGYIYTLRPILFIVPKGAPPAAVEARKRDAEALRGRFEGCTKGIALARSLHDVAVREPIFRNSADLPAPFRTVLNDLAIGKLTAPDTTAQGIEMFALCGRKATRANTPQKEAVRQQLFTKRYDAQSKDYLQELRKSAMIEYKMGAR